MAKNKKSNVNEILEVMYDAKFDSYRSAPITQEIGEKMENLVILGCGKEMAELDLIVGMGFKISIQRVSSEQWYKASGMTVDPEATDAGMMITCEADSMIRALMGLLWKINAVDGDLSKYDPVTKRGSRVWR